VLLIDALTPSGGGERLAMQIAMRLDPSRFHRTLCVSRWVPSWAERPGVARALEELRAADVDLLLIERSSKTAVWSWRPLWKRMRSGHVDVLHAHKFGSNVWGTALGRLARVPAVVAHEHTWSFEGQPLRRLVDRELVARGSDVFIAVSNEDQRRMVEVERIDPSNLMVLPNGIPARAASGSAGALRDELGLAPDDPLIGTVAVLRPQKALDVLVRAARKLVDEFPRLHVAIAGEGPERERLEPLIAELGLGEHVHLLGMRTDVPDVLAGLDVAVSSSAFEGSPLAILEYMQAGLPVVATRVGGVPDIVANEETGVLVEPGDADALAAAIAGLLRDPDKAAAMGRGGRERQQHEFDLDLMVRRLEGIYERLLAPDADGAGGRRRVPVAARTREAPAQVELVGEPAAAREQWQQLGERSGNLFATWEWADAWWGVYGEGRTPLVSVARRADGTPLAVLPLYAWRERPARVIRMIGHGAADELGPVCAREDRVAAAAALSRALEGAGRWDLLIAERLRAGEDWGSLLGARPISREESPVLRFPGGFEEFLAARSRNFREQVRRRERKLARAHEISYRLADDPQRLHDDLTTLFSLHAARWADEGANAFAGPRERLHRDFATRALERGWLRLWLLEADGAPVAAWYGFRFGGAEWYYQAGRDPAWDDRSVGFVLMAHTIRAALDDGVHEYRFLIGGEEYKSRFASDVEYMDSYARAATTRGRLITAAQARARKLPPALKRPIGRFARG
jgi:glycosyltransferase involved in cell wall biosynthesis/CelD/BcsL family acetyltransferase involved in cellulose biosynthesis